MPYPGSVPQAYQRVPRVAGEDRGAEHCAWPSRTPKFHPGRTLSNGFEAVPSKFFHMFLDNLPVYLTLAVQLNHNF